MNNAIVINYRNMSVGGIENYAFQVIQRAIIDGFDVYWLCDVHPQIADIYREVLDSDKIYKIPCDTHGINWFKHNKIEFEQYANVIVLSFSFFDQLRMLEFIKKNSAKNMIPFFVTAHFTGGLMFPEQNFSVIAKLICREVGKIYKKIAEAGEIIYLARNHIDAIEHSYGIQISKKNVRSAPSYNERRIFDVNKKRERYHSEEFRIISAGRFEFPHKGYLLGLIDVFSKMANRDDRLRLLIVGDGVDKNKVVDKINNLPIEIRRKIVLFPMMSPEKLLDLYQECNLSISVAGCASMGARNGLLTLPARHYTDKCEVYGFFPESKSLTTATKPGYDAEEYIEKVLNMSEEQYIAYSKAAYDSFSDNKDKNIKEFLELSKETRIPNISRIELFKIKVIFYLDKVVFYTRKIRKNKNE